jgi:hypothetical protein
MMRMTCSIVCLILPVTLYGSFTAHFQSHFASALQLLCLSHDAHHFLLVYTSQLFLFVMMLISFRSSTLSSCTGCLILPFTFCLSVPYIRITPYSCVTCFTLPVSFCLSIPCVCITPCSCCVPHAARHFLLVCTLHLYCTLQLCHVSHAAHHLL